MIQELGNTTLNNTIICNNSLSDNDIIFIFNENNVIVSYNKQKLFPYRSEIKYKNDPIYLFSIDCQKYYLLLEDNYNIPDNFKYDNVRNIRRQSGINKTDLFSMFTAFHLYNWYISEKYCGKCGALNERAINERAMHCKQCGNISYPRINPAVIVGITNGNQLLITRYASGRGVSFDALVAGFTEIGETLEETVKREVMEEVGLKVKNIRYYKSQPWGLSGTILAGFFCDVDGNDLITLDKNELSSAIWTDRKDICGQPDDMSLTNEMMIRFRDGDI